MFEYIDEETKRWPFIRALGIFLLSVFGILALGTEVVDVANGYFNQAFTAQIGLGIVSLPILWAIAFIERETLTEVRGWVGLIVILTIPCCFTYSFFVTNHPIGKLTLPQEPRTIMETFSNISMLIAVLLEASYLAGKDYWNVKSERENQKEQTES